MRSPSRSPSDEAAASTRPQLDNGVGLVRHEVKFDDCPQKRHDTTAEAIPVDLKKKIEYTYAYIWNRVKKENIDRL